MTMIETKHPQLHYYRNLALRILHWSFTVANSDGMAMYNGPCPVSNLSQTFQFSGLESKEGLGRRVKTDVNKCGLAGVDPQDRDAWRAGVRHSLVLPTP